MKITQIISSEKFKKNAKLLLLVTGIFFLCVGILLLLPGVQNLVLGQVEKILLQHLISPVLIMQIFIVYVIYFGFALTIFFAQPKFALYVFMTPLFFPFGLKIIFGTMSGLDPSWMFALNYAAATGNTFDSSWSFTYGPLGFLSCTQNMANNIFYSQIFWLVITFAFAFLLFYISTYGTLKNKEYIFVSIVFVLSFSFSKISGDYVLVFIATAALLASHFCNKKFILIFDIIFVFAFFIKFTMVIFLCAAIFPLWIFQCIKNKKFFLAINLLLSFSCAFIFYAIFFCKGSAPFFSFCKYIRGALEIASGYNVSMSVFYFDIFLVVVTAIFVLYVLSIFVALKKSEQNLIALLTFLFPLFLTYKHGFVRADVHIFSFFLNFIACVLVIALFFDWQFMNFVVIKKQTKSMSFLLVAFLTSFCFYSFVRSLADLNSLDFSANTAKLPPVVIEKIGDKSVSIYPWEISYIAGTNLYYKQIPTFQAYSAYTPYLDNLTFDFYSNDDAPEFIIFSAETIDDRWPFIESPATWQAIYKNYEFDSKYDEFILLKRKTNLQAKKLSQLDLKFLDKKIINKKDSIQVKNRFIAINAKLSLWGKITKILWKIPAVNMTCTFYDGKKETHRILLDNLVNGYDFKNIFRGQNLAEYFSTFDNANEIVEISFGGNGLKFYKKNFVVSFYTVD